MTALIDNVLRNKLEQCLSEAIGAPNVLRDEPMSLHTSFEIGGPARLFITPGTIEEALAAMRICRELDSPLFALGLGCNLLVSDSGVDGVVMCLSEHLKGISRDGDVLTVLAGTTNKELADYALEASLTGYEFASGIPGTIGGAAIMNAGAYDGEFKDVAVSVTAASVDGELVELSAEEAEWGYRSSRMMREGMVVLSARIALAPGDITAVAARMDELRECRSGKQPLEYPSAGSTFKRPDGYFAGKLIQDAGLKGFSVGGAQVSAKHSGFVINTGGATAADVRGLIREVQRRVFEMEGVRLEPEVRMWGFDD